MMVVLFTKCLIVLNNCCQMMFVSFTKCLIILLTTVAR